MLYPITLQIPTIASEINAIFGSDTQLTFGSPMASNR